MARKGWTNLKASYRSQLEKAGITQSAYESGASLRKARRHAKTPEHHRGYNQSSFKSYAKEQQRIALDIETLKQQHFGGSAKWNATKSAKTSSKYMGTKADMIRALTMSREEMIHAIREDPNRWAFLGYGAGKA